MIIQGKHTDAIIRLVENIAINMNDIAEWLTVQSNIIKENIDTITSYVNEYHNDNAKNTMLLITFLSNIEPVTI